MSYYEDLTRIRVNEAIQNGLMSQEAGRELDRGKRTHWKVTVVVVGLAVLGVIFLAIPGVLAGM
jgi:hypothetical protein